MKQHHKADELLASALYFNYTSVPLLDTLQVAAERELPSLGEDDRAAKEIAWLCDFLYVRGLLAY